jgi:hypothetical protein
VRVLVEWADIGGIDFNRHRLADEIDLKDEAESSLFLHQDSFDAAERAGCDFTLAPYLQVRIRIHGDAGFEETPYPFNLIIRDGFRMTFVADKPNSAGNIQDLVTVGRGVHLADKNVAREQWKPDFLFPVFPTPEDLPHREEYLDGTVCQFDKEFLFKAASGVERVPGKLR